MSFLLQAFDLYSNEFRNMLMYPINLQKFVKIFQEIFKAGSVPALFIYLLFYLLVLLFLKSIYVGTSFLNFYRFLSFSLDFFIYFL